jgi:uncharacterized protein
LPKKRDAKPAIVVTVTSSGIGREIARVAAREGGTLVLIGRSQDALADLASELAAAGSAASTYCADLAAPEAGAAIEAELQRLGLNCDVLVNSAGYGLFGPVAELDEVQQLGVVDVNARALTELTMRFLPGMLARKRGGILNVGSIAGLAPGPNMAVYYATKAYVRSFSQSLAMEVHGSGVTVTCLTPGFVRTAFFDRCKVGDTSVSKLFPRMNADRVAQAGWQAFRARRRTCIPGWENRVIAQLLRLTPEFVLLRAMRVMQARK